MEKLSPENLYEKILKQSMDFDNKASFDDIFSKIIYDVSILHIQLTVRVKVIKEMIINIKNMENIYSKHEQKLKKLSLHINNIIDAVDFISDNIYEITRLIK